MPQIGCLGDIPFIVSSNKTKTPNNIQWSGSARYGEHQRHLSTTLTEFTGIDPDKMSFDIMLSSELGVKVMSEIEKIASYKDRGKTLPLVLGSSSIGRYRWTIKNFKVSMKYFDPGGNLSTAVVSLSLQEYTRT